MDGIIINSVQGQVSKTFLLEQNQKPRSKLTSFGIYVTTLKRAHCQDKIWPYTNSFCHYTGSPSINTDITGALFCQYWLWVYLNSQFKEGASDVNVYLRSLSNSKTFNSSILKELWDKLLGWIRLIFDGSSIICIVRVSWLISICNRSVTSKDRFLSKTVLMFLS